MKCFEASLKIYIRKLFLWNTKTRHAEDLFHFSGMKTFSYRSEEDDASIIWLYALLQLLNSIHGLRARTYDNILQPESAPGNRTHHRFVFMIVKDEIRFPVRLFSHHHHCV